MADKSRKSIKERLEAKVFDEVDKYPRQDVGVPLREALRNANLIGTYVCVSVLNSRLLNFGQ